MHFHSLVRRPTIVLFLLYFFQTGDVPTLQKEDVTKAQDMYDRFSVDLEKQKEEYAKENPQVVLQDESLVYQTPLERSVSQILEGMQEIRELTK